MSVEIAGCESLVVVFCVDPVFDVADFVARGVVEPGAVGCLVGVGGAQEGGGCLEEQEGVVRLHERLVVKMRIIFI